MRFFDGHLTSRWREVSESEFRMPPTCPERSEGSSQIRGLAPRSIRAYALKDTSLPLSRQRLTTVSAFSFALAAFGSSSFARPLTPVIAANHNTICVADGAPGHKPSCVSEVQSNLTTPPDSALGAIDVALGGTHACAIVQSNAKDGKSEERGITCWGQTAM
ncbi:MAG: hypothetical protein NTV34_13460, partial [Proteobacteria bacterium]|nr:hypothetical protein [Pseudomonadota bacterium]